MNPYNMQNNQMMMQFNFNQNIYGMNNLNPIWNMNLLEQFNILNQKMSLLDIQGGNSKPKSEPITLIFKRRKKNIS